MGTHVPQGAKSMDIGMEETGCKPSMRIAQGKAKRRPGLMYGGNNAPCKGKSVKNQWNIPPNPFAHIFVYQRFCPYRA